MTIGLSHYLTVAAILFTLGIFGIFLNRKNVIVILMQQFRIDAACGELRISSPFPPFMATSSARSLPSSCSPSPRPKPPSASPSSSPISATAAPSMSPKSIC